MEEKKEMEEQVQEPIREAMIINPNLYRTFMKAGKDFHNLIAMYLFYTYNAQYQRTNQPHATDKFVQDSEEIVKLFERYEYI